MTQTLRCVVLLLLWLVAAPSRGQGHASFVTADIDRFWQAYDRIVTTKDSAQQYAYLNTLFLQPGSPGLQALRQARTYTAQSYVEAINRYPRFWQSVRPNTARAPALARKAAAQVRHLRRLYPDLRMATTYFTMGAFRTGGTAAGNMVLLGSELALADATTNTTEFGPDLAPLKAHIAAKTEADVLFTVVHEYVHTQQKTTLGNTLLAQCVLEGVAEFVAVTATGHRSTLPALAYGAANAAKVKQRFGAHLLNPSPGFWLYSNEPNEFDTRDLGYYVGYALCQGYYERAGDKKGAIKTMIELDYNDEAALLAFVDQAGYFSQASAQLKAGFGAGRPRVLGFTRGAGPAAVTPGRSTITLTFSSPMDPQYRNFELGPLGVDHLLRVQRFLGFSADGTTATVEVVVQPNRHYQLLVGDGFRSRDGRSLQPFLIDFTSAAN
ncbi:hypothetical protein I2I05_21120 [Hymenobacter sp. BT683]|uniref:SbsA Ig-like domain-containing protein n=1 Tax=Hymenobacter jeongseonensis TaxID=2791027 RepID=A0ABS0INY7_9BACT|nr:hypothetical protein [Hymenobacter jeongseonensis]MBF9239907.1 hypothetical protein [Hymenobacter jeongseonensis]